MPPSLHDTVPDGEDCAPLVSLNVPVKSMAPPTATDAGLGEMVAVGVEVVLDVAVVVLDVVVVVDDADAITSIATSSQ